MLNLPKESLQVRASILLLFKGKVEAKKKKEVLQNHFFTQMQQTGTKYSNKNKKEVN